jgi:glycosyltransferase involved in cell wall biosynthesis
VRDKGIEGVHFTGRIGVEALAEIVSRSWVNVHCSMSEGWGYSILEASASGTPTVAYAVPGVSETVEPGVNGILVADRDVDALVDATESVVLDHAEWIARSRIFAERFTWDVAANRWRNHFSAMIAGSSG